MNTLDLQIRRSESYMSFRNSLLKAGCPTAKLTSPSPYQSRTKPPGEFPLT